MKEGFYDKMEMELQGQQNTYYVGLLAFELIEEKSANAVNQIGKHFANDGHLPNFTYVNVNLYNYSTRNSIT